MIKMIAMRKIHSVLSGFAAHLASHFGLVLREKSGMICFVLK
jgi:hypothetical protein